MAETKSHGAAPAYICGGSYLWHGLPPPKRPGAPARPERSTGNASCATGPDPKPGSAGGADSL